jgi:hypothetical protein
MKNPFDNQFGLIIAYLLPGFIGLAGVAPFVPAVAGWLLPVGYSEASLGPPLYALLAATTTGMTISCFRWLLIDHFHHWTGVVPPIWDDSLLARRLTAFTYLVENHYRYYQFVANTLVALLWTYSIARWLNLSPLLSIWTDVGVLGLCAALFAASRDALTKYYTRTARLIGVGGRTRFGEEAMYNGNHHSTEAGGASKPAPQPKSQSNLKTTSKPEQKSPPRRSAQK